MACLSVLARISAALIFLTLVVPSVAQSANRTAAAGTVTVQSLSLLDVVDNLDETSCSAAPRLGTAAFECVGLAGRSHGQSCLIDHILIGDRLDGPKELACVKSCPGGERNSDACENFPCINRLAGRPYFKTFAALPADVKTRLAADYNTLIQLVRAEGTPQYAALGGDSKRGAVKRDILGIVLKGLLDVDSGKDIGPGEMLPFGECILERASTREKVNGLELHPSKRYGQAPRVNTGNPADASPMDTSANGNLNVYESAFLRCSRVSPDLSKCLAGQITAEFPDLLAGEILHELVHFNQFKFGHEMIAKDNVPDDAKSILDEIMAYGVSREHLYYRQGLSPANVALLTGAGMKGQVAEFQNAWRDLGEDRQEEVALWAHHTYAWMRARLTSPNRPADEGRTWSLMCSAIARHNQKKHTIIPCY
ncbi:hypothetical protein Acid345_0298 [Candidatus Koribacter versatilis Ellin345]|uniref:Uncharacterized protein n=1 Tax=Koribacter versatilis (strain Ellin345) TaxID=204669 RepID=Q1IUZ7_KORVE|nr:hypothetical protein [Candidatus Koribacter versatilis]ABF39303.1 hypothetical protein Acid345_0298 [Candidatus Koribacter versatilis Ellin345]